MVIRPTFHNGFKFKQFNFANLKTITIIFLKISVKKVLVNKTHFELEFVTLVLLVGVFYSTELKVFTNFHWTKIAYFKNNV